MPLLILCLDWRKVSYLNIKILSFSSPVKRLAVKYNCKYIPLKYAFKSIKLKNNQKGASSPLQALMPENSSMIATQVASPFLSPLKLTFYLSLMISLPYFFSEMWRFIAPGLYKTEKRFALGLTLSSILLFYLGILFL